MQHQVTRRGAGGASSGGGRVWIGSLTSEARGLTDARAGEPRDLGDSHSGPLLQSRAYLAFSKATEMSDCHNLLGSWRRLLLFPVIDGLGADAHQLAQIFGAQTQPSAERAQSLCHESVLFVAGTLLCWGRQDALESADLMFELGHLPLHRSELLPVRACCRLDGGQALFHYLFRETDDFCF